MPAKPNSATGGRVKRLPPGVPDAVDVHVGECVRRRRKLLGISQTNLGDAVGLTFQQIQKYERGANRIGSSRLFQFSRILDVPITFFFEGLPNAVKSRDVHPEPGLSDQTQEVFGTNHSDRAETMELVRAYYKIGNPGVRKSVYELTKTLGKVSSKN